MINFFRLSTASMTQMSTLRHSKVICMQKQQTNMKPVFKKQMFMQFKASVIKHNHLEPWSRLLLQSCIGRRSLPWWWTLLPWCCWAWALCWSASWSSQPQTTGSRFLTRHHPGKCKQMCQICCLHASSNVILAYWTYIDPRMIEHLRGCISRFHLHL